MSDRSIAVPIIGVALLVFASAVFLPAFATAVPANQVPVTHQPDAGTELETPSGDGWAELDAREIPMASAPSGLPGANVVGTQAVDVKTAYTDSKLYVWLQWEDDTQNTTEASLDEFTDGAAVQLPANVTTSPSVELGSQDKPVNLWYWTATDGAEEALAGGYNPGSITEMENTTIETNARYQDGTWTVVMERSLVTEDDARADFDLETDVDIAFAVWDGANAERSGHHAYSEWYTIPLGPEETGPSAQYLLWAVAGVGIVIALVIVARTRWGQ